jgi:poly-gamma-glutamate synthesis protein (capsule biosynthesis protein)
VVGHATRPQLRLSSAEAADLVARRGSAGVVGSVGAVERRPDAVGVVPLSEVGPTVTVARVDGVDPVRDHDDATTLLVTGDVMLTRGVPDPTAALAPMRTVLRSADLTVGNLESTLSTDGPPQQGGDSFGGSPVLVPVLEDAGYDALSLANNHTGDYGEQALVRTVDTLRGSRIRPFGAGSDLARAARPAILRAGGTSFAFLGFNAIGETPAAGPGSPGALCVRMPPRTGPLVESDLARVTRAIRAAHRSADVVVVLPHWGTQYTHQPDPVERTVARRLVAAGADLVVGGHPHWVQGVDAVDRVPVLHSLGNFVFDMDFSAETMEGVVLEATFWGSDLKAVRLLPYRMDPGSFAPRRIRGQDVLADVWSTSTGPFAG